MTSIAAIGHEFRRIVLSRKYFYLLLLLGLSSHKILASLMEQGAYGTAPFSRVSYMKFVIGVNPLLLAILALLCAAVFSEKELAARKILFSSPISPAGYFAIKGTAIAGAFLIAVALPILYSFALYAWQFRFFQYTEFIHPILVFLLPPAIFTFGLAMAMGKVSVKLVYVCVPVLFLSGVVTVGLPVWMDLCGTNFLLNYQKALFLAHRTNEMAYHLPTNFLLSRILLASVGVLLFGVACHKIKR